MSERKRLHPAHIVIGVFAVARGFLPLAVLFAIRGEKMAELAWLWISAGIGLPVIALLTGYLQWRKFGFWLEEDRIVIRSGLLFREEKTIYYSRIHSVNIEQPLIKRLFGVAGLNIETPGGGKGMDGNKKADGVLPALALQEAHIIRDQLREFAEARRHGGQSLSQEPSREPSEASSQASSHASSQASSKQSNKQANDAAAGMASPEIAMPDMVAPKIAMHSRASGPAKEVRLGTAQLFKAAATSLNFGLALAFLAGVYSFADDFLDMLLPDGFFERITESSTGQMPIALLIVTAGALVIVFAWMLSILLYVLKFSGFTMRREGKQVQVSYGLLEKRTYLFDPRNVQAVVVTESYLRQPFRYAEVKLQIVSSDKQDQLMLHPFIRLSEVEGLLKKCVPQFTTHDASELAASPKEALLYYWRIPLAATLAVCAGLIVWLGWAGVWSLLLVPLVAWWRADCRSAAGLALGDGQLALRRRFLHRSTYYVKRRNVVMMRVRRSNSQRRKGLITLAVQVLGSGYDYRVACMRLSDVEPIWNWYSRHLNLNAPFERSRPSGDDEREPGQGQV